MLTVKYLQGDHCETIAEYESVTAEIIDGSRVVHAHDQTAHTQYGPIPRNEGDGGSVAAVAPTIYVMNRFGATVATYRL